LNPNEFVAINRSERYVIMTMLKLLKNKDVELLLHPKREEYYINAKPFNMLIIGNAENPSQVTVVNHKYHYILPFSCRAINIFKEHFIQETVRRREELLIQYINNTENALKTVHDSIHI
jgi:hypothetical protein